MTDRSLQWANTPLRPVRENDTLKSSLYGVLSLLNRIWESVNEALGSDEVAL